MKQQTEITLEPLEIDALRRGRAIALDVGGHTIRLRFDGAAAPRELSPANAKRRATSGRCGQCKRDLAAGQKHSRRCRALRSLAASKKRTSKEVAP